MPAFLNDAIKHTVVALQMSLPPHTRTHTHTGLLPPAFFADGELLSNEIFRRSKVSWTVEPSGTSRSTSIELSIDPKAGVGTEG